MGTVHNLVNTGDTEIQQKKYYDIPKSYRERPKWFLENFGDVADLHIAHLQRVCGHLPTEKQATTFSDIVDGYVHVHYGKFSIFFPAGENPGKLTEWIDKYDLEIDGKIVPINTGIHAVESQVTSSVASATNLGRLSEGFFPPKVRDRALTTQNIIVRNTIRIQRKLG